MAYKMKNPFGNGTVTEAASLIERLRGNYTRTKKYHDGDYHKVSYVAGKPVKGEKLCEGYTTHYEYASGECVSSKRYRYEQLIEESERQKGDIWKSTEYYSSSQGGGVKKIYFETQTGREISNYVKYYPNGNVCYSFSRKDLEYPSFNEKQHYQNDQLSSENFHDANDKLIKSVEYYPNGQEKEKTTFDSDGEESSVVFYQETGAVLMEFFYQKGNVVEVKTCDDQGNLSFHMKENKYIEYRKDGSREFGEFHYMLGNRGLGIVLSPENELVEVIDHENGQEVYKGPKAQMLLIERGILPVQPVSNNPVHIDTQNMVFSPYNGLIR